MSDDNGKLTPRQAFNLGILSLEQAYNHGLISYEEAVKLGYEGDSINGKEDELLSRVETITTDYNGFTPGDPYRQGIKIVDDDSQIDSNLPKKLQTLLNQFSAENVSGTPDFILSEFVLDVLKAYNEAVSKRAEWRGESVELHSLPKLRKNVEYGELAFSMNPDLSIRDQMRKSFHGRLDEAEENFLKATVLDGDLNYLTENYVLEEYPIDIENIYDPTTPDYRIRVSTEFRLRRKASEETSIDESIKE